MLPEAEPARGRFVAVGGDGVQEARLAAGTGAQVEPAGVRAFHRHPGQGQGDELAGLVLDGGA